MNTKLKITRFLLSLIVGIILLQAKLISAQPSGILKQKFHPDSVKFTIDEFHEGLSKHHPAYYRYNSVARFDSFIDSLKASFTDSLTILQSYEKLKMVIANINCLHTEIIISEKQRAALNKEPNLFPFQILFDGDQAFVVKNKSDNSAIQPGDELLSINGRNVSEIRDRLFTLIPTDGYNLTMKYRTLYLLFPLWYRIIDPVDDFQIELKQNGVLNSYQISGGLIDDIAEDNFISPPIFDRELEFEILDGIAYLTINTFSNSDIRAGKQKFKKFIDQAFSIIADQGIENLVVDVRDNTGGSDSNAAYFTGYFFEEPFRYWDRIEVTKAATDQIKGINQFFFRKPIKKDSSYLWRKSRITKEFDFFEEQTPSENPFSGNAYFLINGFCMSSCSDVVAILSDNKKIITVGQETGGGYQGNSSGMMPVTIIEPYGFGLTVPLQNYFNAVDPITNAGRGTIPDYPVRPSVEKVLSGKDIEKDTVIKLIEATYK